MNESKTIIESGSVGGGPPDGHSFELIQLPDGRRVVQYEVHESSGTASTPDELDEEARDNLGEYFFDNKYPQFCKWWKGEQCEVEIRVNTKEQTLIIKDSEGIFKFKLAEGNPGELAELAGITLTQIPLMEYGDDYRIYIDGVFCPAPK